MKILGIETATDLCGAAVVGGGKLLSQISLTTPHVHSEKLVPLIDESLRQAGTVIGELDGIAVSIGPGSFTGLRIGLSVAKGLCFASRKPLTAVGTLEAVAYDSWRREITHDALHILSLIDARRDELYAALYQISSGGLKEVIPPAAFRLEDIYGMTSDLQKLFVAGPGSEKFRKFIEKVETKRGSAYIIPVAGQSDASAAGVAFLGAENLKRGKTESVDSLEPLYVKEFYTVVQQPKVQK